MNIDDLIKLCEKAKLQGCTEIKLDYRTELEAAYLDVVLNANHEPAYEIIPEIKTIFLDVSEGDIE